MEHGNIYTEVISSLINLMSDKGNASQIAPWLKTNEKCGLDLKDTCSQFNTSLIFQVLCPMRSIFIKVQTVT